MKDLPSAELAVEGRIHEARIDCHGVATGGGPPLVSGCARFQLAAG